MPRVANAWRLHLDRGPNWLFVRLLPEGDDGYDEEELAQRVSEMLDQHFMNRVVLELDDVDSLSSLLLGQLIELHTQLHAEGGLMRVCGLSPMNQRVLRISRLDTCFPCFANRMEAVRGHRPSHKPR